MPDPQKYHRRSIRLQNYDYAQAGAYFVTICTHGRASLLGEIVDGEMRLNIAGEAVIACWQNLPRHFSNVELDAFVVMPNHVHGIIVITEAEVGAKQSEKAIAVHRDTAPTASPLRMTNEQMPHGTQPGSLAAIIQNFKSVSARKINAVRFTPGQTVWQRNYYEHVIRNENDLAHIRNYIVANPVRWAEDENNPATWPSR